MDGWISKCNRTRILGLPNSGKASNVKIEGEGVSAFGLVKLGTHTENLFK